MNARRLAKSLLLEIEHRGPDATGAAWWNPAGAIEVQKDAEEATKFVRTLSVWKKATSVILHTRFPTQGSKHVMSNNHPIPFRNIVGVHNGSVYNDDQLYRDMALASERKGLVDSSAIFAALAAGLDMHPTQDRTRIEGATGVIDVLQALEGGIATAWFDAEHPGRLHMARLASSPLHFAQTQGGSVIFASTKEAIEVAVAKCNLTVSYWHECEEGEYIEVQDGKVVGWQRFTPNRSYRSWSSRNYTAWDLDDYTARTPFDVKKNGVTTKYAYSDAVGGFIPVSQTAEEAAEVFMSSDDEAGAQAAAEKREREWGHWLDGSLFDPDAEVEAIDRPWRSAAVSNFLERRAEAIGLETAMEATDALGGCLAEGDWVKLDEFGIRVNVYARIVNMPTSFPMGKYTLVAQLPFEEGFEGVFVQRSRHQFKLVPLAHQQAVTKLHSQVAERGLDAVREALQGLESRRRRLAALPKGDYEVPSFIEREEVGACQ